MAAEAALASIAFKASTTALQRTHCIWGAKEDLIADLLSVVQQIQAVVVDADLFDKRWIEGLTRVLYEADALLDEIDTDNLRKLQNEGNKMGNKVRALLNPFFPCSPSFKIAKRLKLLTQSLLDKYRLSIRLVGFKYRFEYPRPSRGEYSSPFVNPKNVIGREDDKNCILELLFEESTSVGTSCPVIIAVVGMVGIGKTTLAQLIVNDAEVQLKFETIWWACLPAATGFTQVVERIFESITGDRHEDFTTDQLEGMIRESLTTSGDYLLILDDVWGDTIDQNDWLLIMELLTCLGAPRSKIIVTTRSLSVPRAIMHIDERHIYTLNGLSDDASWELFKRRAFTEERVNDLLWLDLGKGMINKCANVPFAIQDLAALLHNIDTIERWEGIKDKNLLSIDHCSIRPVLKLSYDHLPSSSKHLFAYCCVFPKGHLFLKEQLIYLWIALRYGNCEEDNSTLEEATQCFMELVNSFIFQEIKVDYHGEIIGCKMHELFHELAGVKHLTRDSDWGLDFNLPGGLNLLISTITRQLSIEVEIDNANSWSINSSGLLEPDQLRSLLVFGNSCRAEVLDQQIIKFRFLRALDLHALNIGEVPCSVGELKQLRYLNLSQNAFPSLPDSITMLVNLLFLDISSCRKLQSLPNDFKRLISLRHLDISYCDSLWHMPPGFGELTSLVELSDFKVSKHGGDNSKRSGLDELAKLNLKGKLAIMYDQKGGWRRDDSMLIKPNHIPEALRVLSICDYPSMKLQCLWKETGTVVMSKLEHLVLIRCGQVQHLPPLKCLPHLVSLRLYHLPELEYIDENAVPTTVVFPCLQKLELVNLPKLKQWSRGIEETSRAQRLLELEIKYCYCLESMPSCPSLQRLWLEGTSSELVTQLLPTCSSPSEHSSTPSSSLEDITINWCSELICFPGEGLTALRKLSIHNCTSLKEMEIGSRALKEISISNCPSLRKPLKEEEERGVHWHLLKNLSLLSIDEIPEETVQSPPQTEDQGVVSSRIQKKKKKKNKKRSGR